MKASIHISYHFCIIEGFVSFIFTYIFFFFGGYFPQLGKVCWADG